MFADFLTFTLFNI